MMGTKEIREQIDRIKNLGKINESRIPTDDNPTGYYDISNALMPDELFKKVDEIGGTHTHDKYANEIVITVDNMDDAKKVRDWVIDNDIYDARPLEDDDMEWLDDYEKLEIKIK